MSENLESLLSAHGMIVLGGFSPVPEDGVPPLASGEAPGAVTLVGNAGPEMWDIFQERQQDEPHPLNAWTRRVLAEVAAALGAEAVYPFSGPPFLPFQRWAGRTGTIFASPMTPAIHPVYGTWFGLRGALLSFAPLASNPPPAQHPCETCVEKPCLVACPVGAITPGHLAAARCLGHLESPIGADCVAMSCRSRRACPVGRDWAYPPAQSAFHMEAFIRDFGTLIRS